MRGGGWLVAMGIREPGCAEFRLTVFGNPGRELPPAVLLASLTEFRAWIQQTQGHSSSPSPSPGTPLGN